VRWNYLELFGNSFVFWYFFWSRALTMVNNDPKYLWSTFDDAWISFLCNSGHRLKAIILSIFVVHKEEPEKMKLFVTSVEM